MPSNPWPGSRARATASVFCIDLGCTHWLHTRKRHSTKNKWTLIRSARDRDVSAVSRSPRPSAELRDIATGTGSHNRSEAPEAPLAVSRRRSSRPVNQAAAPPRRAVPNAPADAQTGLRPCEWVLSRGSFHRSLARGMQREALADRARHRPSRNAWPGLIGEALKPKPSVTPKAADRARSRRDTCAVAVAVA